jgi:antitoxin component of MazEF toxin-antitoxin module
MATIKRRADERGRVTLGGDFANQTVIVEQVGEGELRIRKVNRRVRRFTLAQLLADVTPDKLHPETDTGPAVGKEII